MSPPHATPIQPDSRRTPVTTSTATTFTLTAPCPAAPKNVPLLVQAKEESDPFYYQFSPGSLTSWEPTGNQDLAKCTVHRSVDGIWSARVPAGAFTDAGGNPNVASTACTGLTTDVASAYAAALAIRSGDCSWRRYVQPG